MRTKPSSQSGFSIIEIALVLIIGGILLTLFSGSIATMISGSKQKTSLERVQAVSEKLKVFAGVNNRLPCVASMTIAIDDPLYARETDCATAAAAGTTQRAGSGTTPGRNIRIGFVPTRALGLPDETGYDAWGSRLIYAVSVDLTNPATFNTTTNGQIRINDSFGTEITNGSNGSFVVVSVGPDRRGGINLMGTPMAVCDDPTPRTDIENCNDTNNIFVSTVMSSNTDAAGHFDDIIAYESNFQNSAFPANAVMAYDRTECPSGWTERPTEAGRIVVGKGSYIEPEAPASVTGTAGPTRTFALGEKGGWATRMSEQTAGSNIRVDNMPPYQSYVTCHKDATFVAIPTPPPPPVVPPVVPPVTPPSSSSSGGGGRVICTHFYRRGRFSRDLWKTDLEFSQLYFFPCTIRGYQFWGIPLVNLMRKHPWIEKIVFPFAYARAEEVAYQMGRRSKPNYFGKFSRLLIEPISFFLGIFVPDQKWEKVHADMPFMLLK